jgi:hypothetical protein
MDYVTSALKASTLAKAGAKAQGEASDLYRAVLGTGGGAGAPQGLFQGYGGIGGSAIGAEFLGGGKGFGEQVVADFSAAKAAETPTRTLKDDWMTSGIPGLTQIGQALGGRTDKQILSAAQVAPEVRESMRTDLNAAADRAANAAGQTASDFALVNDNTAAAAAAMKVLGDNAQDGGVAAGLAADGLAVVNKLTGQVVTDYRDYVKFLSQADTGRTIVDFADVVRQSARQLRAAFAGIDARLDDALKVGIPAQIAQQAITSPLIAPSAGIVPTGGLGGAVGAGAGPQVTRYLGLAQASQNDVKDMQQAGFEAMGARVKEFEPGKLKEFNTELGIAKDYATQVQLVTKAISLEQANLSAKQFTDQMFYLNRQLSDAKGLAGQAGGANNLGALQRQSFMIGREQTSLGLGLQQRQITTAVAVAGFQAPGESGEERYARREEALAKARIEQRQLNLSRRQFGVQGQIFNVSAARGVGDAQRSISMANAERKTSLDVAAGGTAIANAERAAAGHLSKATAIYDAASQKFGVGLDETVSLMAQYGKTMKEANDALQGALKDLLDPKTGIAAIVANAVGAAVTPTSTPGVGGVPQYATKAGPPAPKHGDAVGDLPGVAAPPGGVFVPPPSAGGKASGFLGMTGGRTTMTVGEAGRETVAILRNPRQMMMGSMGGGGGGGGVTVIVTGNTFSGREDEQRLIQRITRAVEQGLGRKGQLMGLRGPAH